ncbi:MAG: phospholipase A [Aliarcobacter sp.]|nr:phospholipase A [Aliarcobacter sp.]
MKKKILLFIYTLSFGGNVTSIYDQAVELEKEGNYKEAMILYKKAANINLTDEDKYIINLSKNDEHRSETFTNMKKAFYQNQINKVEDKETDENLKQYIVKDFDLFPYKKNYLLPATYNLNKVQDQNHFETSFQISIEKPISYDFFRLNESISAAYTQKSFWQTTKDSSPFRETNYEPEIFVQFPFDNEVFKSYKVSLLHSSNGRNDEDSRSWNRVYLEGYFQFSNLFLIPKVWYRLPESDSDDNPDIEDYYGKGELTLLYAYKKHTFELMLRNNLDLNSSNKGGAELNWTFPLPEFLFTKNTYGLLQLYSGYGSSLIDYDREVNRIGLGIAFSR